MSFVVPKGELKLLFIHNTDTIDIMAQEIRAHSVWGMLRGLESFSQLIIPDTNEMVGLLGREKRV